MAVGEAHWQNGIVARHIGKFREMLSKLFLEDILKVPTTKPQWTMYVNQTTVWDLTTVPPLVNGF